MNLIMYAEVFKDDTWHFVDEPIFKIALPEMQGYLTNRVCDEHNYVLFEVLTGMHFDFNDIYTTIPTIGASKWLPVDVSEERVKINFRECIHIFCLYRIFLILNGTQLFLKEDVSLSGNIRE